MNNEMDGARPPDEPYEGAFRALHTAAGVGEEDLLVLDEREVTYPHLGERFRLYKVLDRATGESRRIAVSAAGEPADLDDVLRREERLRQERYGALQPALSELLDNELAPTVPVLIKVAVNEEPLDKAELDLEGAADAVARRAAAIRADVQQRALGLLGEALAGLPSLPGVTLPGVEELRADGPFVAADLPRAAIQSLGRDRRIAFIGLDREPEIFDYPTITESLPTTRTNSVHGAGSKGAGVKIAVLEGGGLTVSAGCFNIGATQNTGAAGSSHMTKSVGIIGNRWTSSGCSGSWQGYAPDATVLLANAASYTNRYEWARDQRVNVVTMSWHYPSEETDGSLHSRDVYFDYWSTRWPYPSVFTSAGNQFASDAYASGKGYNFFGVGNVNNDGDSNRCNNTIASSSSSKNPTSSHGDREIPEIATPGSRHELLGSSFGGTSCATPVAASIATLLMSTNSSLKYWPEAVRAILLATANYQGADGKNWATWSDGRDGSGLANAVYGHWTGSVREQGTTPRYRAHDYGSIKKADFSGGFFTKTWTAQTYSLNSRIRVAFTWNSKTSASSGGTPVGSVLDSDLDIWLYDADGQMVASSSSWDGNYEFIEHAPTKTGIYTVKVRGYSVPDDFWSYYGVAWTTHYDIC